MAETSGSDNKGRTAEMAASKEAALEAYEKLLEAQQHFRHAAEAAGMDLKQDAVEQLHRGRDKADELGQEASRYVQDKPLASLGIAFVFGYILSQLFSRR